MKESSKKIIVFSHGNDAGGIERSMIEFLKFITSDSRNKVDIYLWKSNERLRSMLPSGLDLIDRRLSPYAIRECRTFSRFYEYTKFRFLRLFGLETKSFKTIDDCYDIAISYTQVGYSPYYVIDRVKARKKILFYHHGSYDKTGIDKRRDLRYYSKFDAIVTMSEANVTMLSAHFPELKGKIVCIGNLIDPEEIAIKATEQIEDYNLNALKEPLITTVARISEEKGQKIAFEAARILKNEGYEFRWFFVGVGPDLKDCKSFLVENNLSDVCIMAGYRKNPYPFMKAADIYVQPSLVESYSITIREAAVFGCPVIASSLPAVEEARDDVFGLITVEPAAERIAKEIKLLLENQEIKEKNLFKTALRPDINKNIKDSIRKLLTI